MMQKLIATSLQLCNLLSRPFQKIKESCRCSAPPRKTSLCKVLDDCLSSSTMALNWGICATCVSRRKRTLTCQRLRFEVAAMKIKCSRSCRNCWLFDDFSEAPDLLDVYRFWWCHPSARDWDKAYPKYWTTSSLLANCWTWTLCWTSDTWRRTLCWFCCWCSWLVPLLPFKFCRCFIEQSSSVFPARRLRRCSFQLLKKLDETSTFALLDFRENPVLSRLSAPDVSERLALFLEQLFLTQRVESSERVRVAPSSKHGALPTCSEKCEYLLHRDWWNLSITSFRYRRGFGFLTTLPFWLFVNELTTCKTVCSGKTTRRGHSAFSKEYKQSIKDVVEMEM